MALRGEPGNAGCTLAERIPSALPHFRELLFGAPQGGTSTQFGQRCLWIVYHGSGMAFPIRVCAICSEEFELKPDKPGFANRCPSCSESDSEKSGSTGALGEDERKHDKGLNEARRQAMRDL